MTAFFITSTIVFFLLFLIWTKKDWMNFAIKAMFFSLSVWGGFLTLEALGYLVKV